MCQMCQVASVGDDGCAFEPLYAGAVIIEVGDAAANVTTSVAIGLGDTFSGNLSYAGDVDWVAVTLTAGTRYDISLYGDGASPLSDPYLRVMDASGTQVGYNDDGGSGLNSYMSFVASSTGTYYLAADSYDSRDTGTYALSIAEAAPIVPYTLDQIAEQLYSGYWGGFERHFDIAPGDTLNVDISGLTAAGQQLAIWALQGWTDATGILFDTAPASGATVHITMDDWDSGAYTSTQISGGLITSAFVNVSTAWLTTSGTTLDSYSYQTYLHELGHALGLGHAGNYNGSATYGVDNYYANDSWQATTMSYFSQTENTYINDPAAYTMTAMPADLIALHHLYGTPTGIRSGNTVYGENTNAGGIYAELETLRAAGNINHAVAVTIFDQGGYDTLDLRSDTDAQLISLIPESINTIYGVEGMLQIARGTIIERLYAGSGNDTITGNDVDNRLYGFDGADSIYGGGGHDTLYGGAGNDRLNGSYGADTIEGGDGTDMLWGGTWSDLLDGGADADTLSGNDGNDTLLGGTGNDILYGGAHNDVLNGGDDDDTLYGHTGNDTLYGGGGHDTLYGGAGNDRLNGSYGADTIEGGDGTDMLWGGTWSDRLDGGADADTLSGNDGNDTLLGDTGNDILYGGAHNDLLNGGDDDDTLYGNTGNDTLYGGGGHDTLYGGAGNDRLSGSYGADTIEGGDGTDMLWGGTWSDLLDGGADADTLSGNDGNDTLLGDTGDDVLYGGAHNDVLNGGAGVDQLVGGTGADTFVFGATSESTVGAADVIRDFVRGVDRISLTGIDANTTVAGDQAFTMIGAAAFSAAGQLRSYISGSNTIVLGDVDGDGTADFSVILTGSLSLAASDFLL
ncbi:M10 family metallopeptidase [Phaeovulum vinaykumarii]|uniref:Serralysin n=1 Tax=Phaeovulum vinaykumarii TaxID=407234 RepID=A0A1N7KCS6_9RHOB|nr:M10 family metallopeptidase [Phaeovulum vinaykumarii]SIS59398.1 serralysin [Phaeovulum vinaykumarii]SOB94110.1 serralysin [Phaeovulum vinaykumarii]